MGLAYGDPKYANLIKKISYQLLLMELSLDMSYFDFATGLTMTNKKFNNLFGGPPKSQNPR